MLPARVREKFSLYKIVTAREMQAIDKRSIEEYGIPGIVLMENAGRGVVEWLWRKFPDLDRKRVAVFAGKGNNGGDGFVVARHLHNRGVEVQVLLIGEWTGLKNDAKTNAEIASRIGIPVTEIGPGNLASQDHRLRHSDILVDAIFGTGLTKPAAGTYEKVIEKINGLGKYVVAVDVPSGVDSDTGQLIGPHIRADLTLSLALLKRCHRLYPAAGIMGEVRVIDIGIPPKAVDCQSVTVQEAGKEDIASWFPKRPPDSHKGNYGHVLVIAGAVGKGGAAGLTALAALRSGCGLATLALPASCQRAVEFHPLEVMTAPMPETESGTLDPRAKGPLLDLCQGKAAVAVGPGLSTHPGTVQLLMELLPDIPCPLVIDADGLNCLAEDTAILSNFQEPAVLTPHPKEMSRLCRIDTREILERRIETASRFAQENSVHVILKGASSLIASPDKTVFINSTGNPGMATAGSGDVLTGAVAGLIAQGLDARKAAAAGTYLHGLAGDLYAHDHGDTTLIAGDLLDYFPKALKKTLS